MLAPFAGVLLEAETALVVDALVFLVVSLVMDVAGFAAVLLAGALDPDAALV